MHLHFKAFSMSLYFTSNAPLITFTIRSIVSKKQFYFSIKFHYLCIQHSDVA